MSLKIICPNGHLGFAPLKTASFRLGVAAGPDFIAADSGSDDIGPVPLGNDSCASPKAWQHHDLEEMLLAVARSRGADDHRLGRRYRLEQPGRHVCGDDPPDRRRAWAGAVPLGWFYSEVDRELVRGEDPRRLGRSAGSTPAPT